jgi:hypothetical protein
MKILLVQSTPVPLSQVRVFQLRVSLEQRLQVLGLNIGGWRRQSGVSPFSPCRFELITVTRQQLDKRQKSAALQPCQRMLKVWLFMGNFSAFSHGGLELIRPMHVKM